MLFVELTKAVIVKMICVGDVRSNLDTEGGGKNEKIITTKRDFALAEAF